MLNVQDMIGLPSVVEDPYSGEQLCLENVRLFCLVREKRKKALNCHLFSPE